MEAPEEVIEKIAGYLERGFHCFIHRQTQEVLAYPETDEELEWIEARGKVNSDPVSFYELVAMPPSKEREMMEDFTWSLENEVLKDRLRAAIAEGKKFSRFHKTIDRADELPLWLAFKKNTQAEWVKRQLKDVK